ncbi:hypothetical protein GOP47_0026435 [Adiantum capillus-veneris]|nr:hypothetical protein GOP47_0026435 [Adiantum capillus-veneris]
MLPACLLTEMTARLDEIRAAAATTCCILVLQAAFIAPSSKYASADQQRQPSLSYDATAYSGCYEQPMHLLYAGGILKNPDFDDGLEWWSPFGTCTLELRSSSPSSTSNALLIKRAPYTEFHSYSKKDKTFKSDSSSIINDTYGGVMQHNQNKFVVATSRTSSFNGPSQLLPNLTIGFKYIVSAWLRVEGAVNESVVKATVMTDGGREVICVGNVVAHNGCWSFLKGGFALDFTPTTSAHLYFETPNFKSGMELWLDRVSVQPFSDEEWKSNQKAESHLVRRRRVSMRVVDSRGRRLHDAHIEAVNTNQLAFNFGSAFSQNLLEEPSYQEWFLERFNTAVFENELKWYATERQQGHVDYSVPDAMFAWCLAHQLQVRGHNIVWNDPSYQPQWLKALAGRPSLLRQAFTDRVTSLVSRYAGRFVGWDVSNEQLHFSFFEDALSDPNASTKLFVRTQQLDPATQLFVNDYNTLERTDDWSASTDAYSAAVRRLREAGVRNLAIGLEAHFTSKPNLAYMRATLDKLATLDCPIWLTELDVKDPDINTAASYLHDILVEAFSHPAVSGIVLWSALDPSGCYRMCLTNQTMANLATGDVVDDLLRHWKEVDVISNTGGAITWRGPVGTHSISVRWQNTTYSAVVTVPIGNGTHHLAMQLASLN